MALTAKEILLLKKLLEKAEAAPEPKPVAPIFRLEPNLVARIEEALRDERRIVIFRGAPGKIRILPLRHWIAAKERGYTVPQERLAKMHAVLAARRAIQKSQREGSHDGYAQP